MKKRSILFFLLVFCVATLFAQAPEKFTYQAVVRNASNQLISNAPVGVRVSILQGGVNGMMVYMETHTAVTNANGLVTLQIGGGTVQQGVFADIDWANGPFFLKTETDPAGGSNYTVTSTQQLLSVPYALYAKEAGNVPQTVGELTNDANYITISDIPEIPTVPTNVSAFFNDAGYITMDSVPTNVSAFANDAGYLTSFTETDPEFNAWDKDYNDLINKPTIPTVPDNVSTFVNDAGYITMDSVPTNVSAFANDAGYLTSFTETDPEFNAWDKDYNDLINKPAIPTVPDNVSAFVNDAGYITMDSVPTNVTAFTNDAGYLTNFTETDPEFNAWDKDYNDLINKPTIPTVPTEISAFANDAGYLTSFTEQQVLSISNDTIFLTGGSFVKLSEGFDGDYNSLTNKPTIPTTVGELTNDANYITLEQVPEQVNADWDATSGAAQILNKPELFSGDYNDLTNKPAIPTTVGELTNDANYITLEQVPTQVNADWNATEGAAQILNKPELFSGDYNDLTNKPTIPTTVGELTNDANYITLEQVPAQVNADWNATTGAAQILNKPELFSGDYNDLTNTPTIPTVPTNVGAFTNDAGYITAAEVPAVSVPTNVSAFENDAEYVTTTQLNAANYITAADVPAQVNADWNATEGAAQILNKPELFSGDYNDLTNKPAIPTVPDNVSAFVNDAGYITMDSVPTNVTAFTNDAGYLTSFTETDPEFNAWDKDYNDLINKPTIPTVPTEISAFANDAGYLTSFTEQQVLSISNDTIFLTGGSFVKLPEGFDGDYNSLTNKPTIPIVPTNVSAFTNDAGYITAANVQEAANIPTNVSAFTNDAGYITMDSLPAIPTNVSAFNNDAGYLTGYTETDPQFNAWDKDYNDLINLPQIPQVPANVSAFNNDAGYITSADIPEIPTVPTNVSAFNNDVGYLTDYTETQTLAQVTANGNSAGNRQLKNVSDPTENLDAVNLRTLTSQMNSLQDNFQQQMQQMQQQISQMQEQIDSLQNIVNSLDTNNNTSGGTAVIDEKSCPAAPTVTDHEGNVYATVQIGSQCWMRDNLRTTTSPSTGTYLIPSAGTGYTYTGKQAFWYNNDSATYAPMNYGLLYNWNAAVDTFNTAYGETSVNTNGFNSVSVTFSGYRRGICPVGWHLPSDAEWTQLENYVSSQSEYTCGGNNIYIAKALASTEGWDTYSYNCVVGNIPSANNATGFSAVPAGNGGGSSFDCAGNRAFFWSSTQHPSGAAYIRDLDAYNASVARNGNCNKVNGFSVRCLRDETGTAVIDEKSCPAAPTVTDHEGNVYATVQIGNQCWMRDNLRTTTSPSTGTYLIPAANANYTYTGKQARWYNNDQATYAPMNYGLLYNWNAAADTFNIAYGETSVQPNAGYYNVTFTGHRRGICPQGWHVPSDAEWTQLTDYVSSQSEYTCSGNIAKALASTEGWNSYSGECYPGDQSVTANNATGFSAVPAGSCYGSSFEDAGFGAYFWSATQYASYPYGAYYRYLYCNYANVRRFDSDENVGYSVRCLRD